MKYLLKIKLVLLGLFCSFQLLAETAISLNIELADIKTTPYHKPFVVVWLEKPNREYVTTLTLWANDKEWYKDLRQWWRKAGRQPITTNGSLNESIDAVTGATRRSGRYQLNWYGLNVNNKPVPSGNYLLNIEAAREEGGREFIRIPITLDSATPKTYNKQGKSELGSITVTTF